MANIEKKQAFNRTILSEEFFFQSLLLEAFNHSLLNETELENLQNQCLDLLAAKVAQYNRGYSSSIRVEVAETIMISNFYTLGLYLKSLPDVTQMVQELKTAAISDIHERGRNLIRSKLHSGRHLFILARQNCINTKNHTYNEIINKEIKLFFKNYNPEYEAHQIPASVDYQICKNITGFAGIEFIQKYIEALYNENMFCRCFPDLTIHHLLCGYDENYELLVINIFEQVLTNALGCILAGNSALNLTLTAKQINSIFNMLNKKSPDQVGVYLYKASLELESQLNLNSKALQIYIKNSLPAIAAHVSQAVKDNTLDKVFIARKKSDTIPRAYFSYGAKMDDAKYRKVIDEINQCRFSSDKYLIIKENIHTLSDLEDLLHDANLTVKEVFKVLSSLEVTEIAALAKRNLNQTDIEAIDLTEPEKKVRYCLDLYIKAQNPACQLEIAEIIHTLQNE